MPANYTLYRFGNEALRQLPGALRRPAQRLRRIYNGSLMGQDLFFFSSPISSPMGASGTGELYDTFNRMTGREFFTRACQWLRENPSEAGLVCLYGLLAHYCLKSCLAPLLAEASADGTVSRVELEVELDRYLLAMDGKTPAHNQDACAGLKMTRGECVTISGFFAPVTEKQYYSAYKKTLRWSRRMAAKKRGGLRLLLKLCRRDFRDQMMPDCANHKCLHLDMAMLECYERALEYYPAMARQLTEYREKGIPLGEEFDPAFV